MIIDCDPGVDDAMAFIAAARWAEALARGVELGTAVERAVHAGAVTATRPGAQPAMPSTVDLEASMAGLAGTL